MCLGDSRSDLIVVLPLVDGSRAVGRLHSIMRSSSKATMCSQFSCDGS